MQKRAVFLISTIFILIFSFVPETAKAEIATVRDWIGLFPINATGNKTSTLKACPALDSVNKYCWAYTSSCTQTAGIIPLLDRSTTPCTFSLDTFPQTGYFIFRMYGNDKDDSVPDALITASNQFSIGSGGIPAPAKPFGKLYRVTGNLTINTDITVNETGVIFIDGNLYINTNILNNKTTKGIVFVVKGTIYINRDVTTVNAYMISHGKNPSGNDITPFCDAWDGTSCNNTTDYSDNTSRKYLTINGSVISLNATLSPQFVRKKYDPAAGNTPAEVFNYDPKYLVIMKDIFSRDLRIWREIQ